MPRVSLSQAVTTKDSIASLWAHADAEGSLVLFPRDSRECYLIRNKLYAYRSKERRAALQHTGTETSPLDRFTFRYGSIDDYDGPIPDGVSKRSWFFLITQDDRVNIVIAKPVHPVPNSPIDDFVFIADPNAKRKTA